jgi:hypothetical protein
LKDLAVPGGLDPLVPKSETNSIADVPRPSHGKGAGGHGHGVDKDGIVLDASREVRVKLYTGQVSDSLFLLRSYMG